MVLDNHARRDRLQVVEGLGLEHLQKLKASEAPSLPNVNHRLVDIVSQMCFQGGEELDHLMWFSCFFLASSTSFLST